MKQPIPKIVWIAPLAVAVCGVAFLIVVLNLRSDAESGKEDINSALASLNRRDAPEKLTKIPLELKGVRPGITFQDFNKLPHHHALSGDGNSDEQNTIAETPCVFTYIFSDNRLVSIYTDFPKYASTSSINNSYYDVLGALTDKFGPPTSTSEHEKFGKINVWSDSECDLRLYENDFITSSKSSLTFDHRQLEGDRRQREWQKEEAGQKKRGKDL